VGQHAKAVFLGTTRARRARRRKDGGCIVDVISANLGEGKVSK